MSRQAGYSAADGDLLLGGRKENLPPEWVTHHHRRHPNPDLKPDTPTTTPSLSVPPNSIIQLRDLKAPIRLQNQVKFTDDDWKTLRQAFPDATCIQYSYPFIIICGAKPPVEPISVKNIIVEFYDHIDQFMYCPGVGGNPSLADPLLRWSEMPDRQLDTFTSIKSARTSLANVLGITICAMSTYLHLLVVEVNEKDYRLDSLPGIVGGRIALWAVYGTLWGDSMARSCGKDPRSSSGDDTDYLPVDICPGVKVCGMERSTSSGLLLRHEFTGQVALSAACHGWDHNDNFIYHPHPNSSCIASIHTRVVETDLALATLAPGISYTNGKYFDAPTPVKIVPEAHVEDHDRLFSYYGVDGFTTGLCWLQLVGFRNIDDSVRAGHYSAANSYIMRQTRASASESNLAKEGICGAPLVHQESDDTNMSKVCVGFFWKYEGTNAVIPTLDYLIDQGWQIA
jgi:hypothetical protein